MPVFSYSCNGCQHQYDVFTLTLSEEIRCPMCGSVDARREVPRVAIRPSNKRRRGLVDLSSNSCPCGCQSGKKKQATA